jgi:hypothetical protein
MGNEKIAEVASAVWSPYWKQGCPNTLVMTGTGGDGSTNTVNVWLNGNKIVTDGITEWYTTTNPAYFMIGSSYAPGSYYTGNFYDFTVKPGLMTQIQVNDYHLKMLKQINAI